MNKLDAAQGQHPSPNFLLSHASTLCIIVGAWLLVYIPGLFHPALLDDADSVHAEAAREILLNHDWVTLYVDGIRYLAKARLCTGSWRSAINFLESLSGRRVFPWPSAFSSWHGAFTYSRDDFLAKKLVFTPHSSQSHLPVFMYSQTMFVRLWNGPSRVYLFTEGSSVNNALNGIEPKTVHALARSGGKIVFTNQPSTLDSNAPSSPDSH